MSELNLYIDIPAKSTQEELISACTAALQSASGITPDADGVFWMDAAKKAGFKFAAYGNGVCGYLVDFEGTTTNVVTQTISCNTANRIWYNVSPSGTCFTFGIGGQSAGTKSLCFVFATDEEGVKRVFACGGTSTSTWYECSPGEKTLSLALGYTSDSSFTSFTMVPLPTGVTRKKHSELYLVLMRPKSASLSTDAAVYSGGKLYKLIGCGTSQAWLAMRV